MNDEAKSCCQPTGSGCQGGRCLHSLVVLAAFLIVGGMIWALVYFTQPAPLTEDRAVLRRLNLAELRATNAQALSRYDWLDQTRDIVRLPIEEAMKLTLQEWQNPAAGRSNLIARVEKATAPLPKVPEKPSQFE